PVTVSFGAADDAAKAPGDYQPTRGTLTFNPGQTLKYIKVTVRGDLLDEATETFLVVLVDSNGAFVADGQASGFIFDNDPAPSVAVGNAAVTEGDSGTKTLSFKVSLSRASGQIVRVSYATDDRTAHSPSDYRAQEGTVTFLPGQVAKSIVVTIRGDTLDERSERFVVDLLSADKAFISDPQAAGVIVDDDP
ncbi:MAG TPA: Calx-beta domain-containing protein, partial [Actinomycetota bacterium]|nr:Calx-beta domain-containing protein [Actinomycetota bacterium]